MESRAPLEAIQQRFAVDLAADPLLKALQRLAAERGDDLYLVGGFIRDWLLLRPHPDLDLVTSGDPRALAQALAGGQRGNVVELDPGFRIYRVMLGPRGRDGIVDLSPLQGATIAEDLSRRDLSINAMAFPLVLGGEPQHRPPLLDPGGGLHDLLTDRIRALSSANLEADPLRLLRVFRFSAALGFAIDPQTLEWASTLAPRLAGVPGERVDMEVAKILGVPMAGDYLTELDQAGILEVIFPELAPLAGIGTDPVHHLDGRSRSLDAVRQLEKLISVLPRWLGSIAEPLAEHLACPWQGAGGIGGHTRETLLKLAALLHLLADVPGGDARRVARRLRLSVREGEYLATLVVNHHRASIMAVPGLPPSLLEAYRLFRELGDAAPGVLLLGMAVQLASQGPAVTHADNLAVEAAVVFCLEEAYARPSALFPPRLLDGHAVMAELGLSPGPVVGELLEGIAEAQVLGQVHTRDEALEWARSRRTRG